jgi:hypothetical protein
MRDIRGKSVADLAATLHGKLLAEEETFTKLGYHHQESDLGLTLHQGNRKQLHCLLARMTDYLEVQSGVPQSRYEEYMAENVKNPYEVEHIWANRPERHSDEFPNADEFRRHRNRIGGLLILPKSFNASYGDLPYIGETPEKSKREHYYGQNLLAASLHPMAYQNNPGFVRFVRESGLGFHACEPFNRADLERRHELYTALAQMVWNPNDLLEGGSNASS